MWISQAYLTFCGSEMDALELVVIRFKFDHNAEHRSQVDGDISVRLPRGHSRKVLCLTNVRF